MNQKTTQTILHTLLTSENHQQLSKPKRGRPRTNGGKPAWMFYRALLIIEGYQQSRLEGKTHRESVKNSVAHVKRLHPEMRVSAREVDRVLAAYHSKRFELSLSARRTTEEIPIFDDDNRFVGWMKTEGLAFGYAPRPEYPERRKRLPKLRYSKKFK